MNGKVMVFGSFDCLHDGHHFFLSEAKKIGSLIVIVAPDEHIKELKNKYPKKNLQSRIKDLEEAYPEAVIESGDATLGSWRIIDMHSPDTIALGYDQKDLALSLIASLPKLKSKPKLHFIPPHHPDKLHSSILNK